MGIRFNKRIKIAPGIKLNISKSGISTTVGKPGASINIGKKGTTGTVGIPGSGLSYTTKLSGGRARQSPPQETQPGQQASGFRFLLVIGLALFFALVIFGR